MGLEEVSPLLNAEADRMERMAERLEELLPAVRRGAADQIAGTAANQREFAGPAELFQVGDAEQTVARFEMARRRVLAALQDPAEGEQRVGSP